LKNKKNLIVQNELAVILVTSAFLIALSYKTWRLLLN